MSSIITGSATRLPIPACALVLALTAAACDKMPLLAPRESTITLSSASSTVQANGATDITAVVLEQSGTPVQNGTTVTFSTNLGSLSPAEARTLNGAATVRFVANGESGTASIRAISGGAASEALDLAVGAAAAQRITLTANPTSVPPTGGVTTVSATIVDASGNPLRGVPVTFSTTAGNFSASVANTDANGVASTMLSTNREASVSASAGGVAPASITIAVSAMPVVSIALASGTMAAEGIVTTFSVTASAATGGAPIQDVTVDFGDGVTRNLGSVSGTVSVQHVYGDDGAFTPTVRATDSTGTTASASTVIVVQPLLVSLSAVRSGSDVSFTANVSPSGAPIASYAWTFGDGSTATTTSNTISHTYAAGTYNARVVARTASGATSQGTATITVP